MFYVNRATLVGNVGSIDMKYTANGVAVLRFGVATSHGVKKGDIWDNITTWHNVVAFSKTAERIGQVLKKGDKVYVEGRIENRKYKDRDGNDRISNAVIASDIITFDKKSSAVSHPQGQESSPAYEGDTEPAQTEVDDINIDEIPF